MLIPLIKWAEQNGISLRSARSKAASGLLVTAVRQGCHWLVDDEEPAIDLRIKSGQYIGVAAHKRELQKRNRLKVLSGEIAQEELDKRNQKYYNNFKRK